jgi:hypothetical protein
VVIAQVKRMLEKFKACHASLGEVSMFNTDFLK